MLVQSVLHWPKCKLGACVGASNHSCGKDFCGAPVQGYVVTPKNQGPQTPTAHGPSLGGDQTPPHLRTADLQTQEKRARPRPLKNQLEMTEPQEGARLAKSGKVLNQLLFDAWACPQGKTKGRFSLLQLAPVRAGFSEPRNGLPCGLCVKPPKLGGSQLSPELLAFWCLVGDFHFTPLKVVDFWQQKTDSPRGPKAATDSDSRSSGSGGSS